MIEWTPKRIAQLDTISAGIAVTSLSNAVSLTLMTMANRVRYSSALLIKNLSVIFQGSAGISFSASTLVAGVYLCPPGTFQGTDDTNPNGAYFLPNSAANAFAFINRWQRVDKLAFDTLERSADVGIAQLEDIVVPAGWALRGLMAQTGQMEGSIAMQGLAFVEVYGCDCQ